jgi:hypothetical protein
MLTKKWLEKELKFVNELEEKAVKRLERATKRLVTARDAAKAAEDEFSNAHEDRCEIRAWGEEYEWMLENFDNSEAVEYNGKADK